MAYSLPLPGITSLLHRISGVLLFAGVAVLLYMLQSSLVSQEGFDGVKECLQAPIAKLVVWVIVSGLLYHFVAGIKHLLMDAGIGESLEGAKAGATITLVLSAVSIALAGFWIW